MVRRHYSVVRRWVAEVCSTPMRMRRVCAAGGVGSSSNAILTVTSWARVLTSLVAGTSPGASRLKANEPR